ncbi:hypothetical protein CPB83DRAFT_849634, partial [Crepidotus variabilis]
MLLRNRPEPLLMGLKELYVIGSLGASDVVLALSPNIKSIFLGGCDRTIRSLLSSFLTSCPRIRTLSWETQAQLPTNPHDITKFKDLQNLSLILPGTYLSSSFMIELGNLEGLQKLTIDVGASDPSKISSSPRRGPPMASYPVAAHKFANLRTLHFLGSIERIQHLLSFMELKSLTYFLITEHRPNVNGTESYWYQCFERLAFSSHLEAIEIEQYRRPRLSEIDKNHIAGSWIKPLCSLTGLHTFIVKDGFIRISTAELSAIASAFPMLRVLKLPSPEESDSFSWESIAMLADHWPQLHTLQITWGGKFKASAISAECVQKLKFRRHRLQCLRIATGFADSDLPHQNVVLLARFLYRFFPDLQKLEGLGSPTTMKAWSDVFDCYKALQTDILYFRHD